MSDVDNTEFIKSIEAATLQIVLDEVKKMDKACLIIERDAKDNCPVDQGMLRASITHEVDFDTEKITGYIGSNLEYAPYVHNGTGIYAINGDGRKTPWLYEAKAGKYKGKHLTRGQRPRQFLMYAELFNKDKVAKALGD